MVSLKGNSERQLDINSPIFTIQKDSLINLVMHRILFFFSTFFIFFLLKIEISEQL